jgi:hypothetical protein
MNKIVSRDERIHHTNYLKEIYKKFTGIRPAKKYGLLSLEVPTSYDDYVKSVILNPFTHKEADVTFHDIIYITHWDGNFPFK